MKPPGKNSRERAPSGRVTPRQQSGFTAARLKWKLARPSRYLSTAHSILKNEGLAALAARVLKKLFQRRWQTMLAAHPEPGPRTGQIRIAGKRILVIDATVLMPDQDSGSLRMFNLLRIFQDLEYQVTFAPGNLLYHEIYTPGLQAAGIECLYAPYVKDLSRYLQDKGKLFDVVLLSRADVAEKYIADARRCCPHARILFDTVDLHYLREQRQAELSGNRLLQSTAAVRKKQELDIAHQADMTLLVSPVEMELLKQEDDSLALALLSNIHQCDPTEKPFSERRDILFIGRFEHPPNTDAMLFFLDEILPLVHRKIPELKVHIIGSNPPPRLKRKSGGGVEFSGFVPDLKPVFNNIRLSVAPLRFGAGIKGKINSSMSFGVPVIATSMATEGMELEHGKNVLVADTAEDFAAAILRAYGDEDLWNSLAKSGLENIEQHFSFAVARRQLESILEN